MTVRMTKASATLRFGISVAIFGAAIAPIAANAAAFDLPGLTEAQRAFVDSPDNLRPFGLTKEKLFALLSARDQAEITEAVTAMMQTAAEERFTPAPAGANEGGYELDPAGDMAAVPLNTDAAGFNGSTVLKPAILDEYPREPGPFSLKRYMYEEGAIPTFAGAPVAIRKEDLVAGGVEVAFVGVPQGLSSGWRDSQNAPETLRAMYGLSGFDMSAGLDPAVELSLADYGNLSIDDLSAELTVEHVREMIAEMASVGVIPFIVGGDHSVMYSTVAAMTDQFGVDDVKVLHLDAHYNGERGLPHLVSDRQVVARLIEKGLLNGDNLVQVGLRDPKLNQSALAWMRSEGIHFHTMADVDARGWAEVMDDATRDLRGGDNIFISFDISVLDPAYATGAGRPAAGGLTMREAVPMIRNVCAETNVVGFEMLDVAPYLDLSYTTALNANAVMHACLTGIAMRKAERR